MCFNPYYRIPVSESLAERLKGCSFIPKYHNGAYVLPKSAEMLCSRILTRINTVAGTNLTLADIDTIPCGQCLDCKIKSSKEWAQRSVAESTLHKDNWFITLTYDDEHLPERIQTYGRHDYSFGWHSPLVYKDFQDFKKRLLERMREGYGITDIRFLMCGEYGPKNGRPHFHVIFYGLPLPDVEKISEQNLKGKNYVYLYSKIVNDSWKKGFITLGEVNWETSAYVGRYVLKKFTNLDEEHYQNICTSNGWKPLPAEMREASRRPGLARPYYDEEKDEIYLNDKVILPNGKMCKPCGYFDRLYDLENPALLCLLKERRKEVARTRESNELIRLNKEKISPQENLKNKAESLKRRLSRLKRDL